MFVELQKVYEDGGEMWGFEGSSRTRESASSTSLLEH